MAAILLFHICPTCSQLPRVCYCFVVSEWASVCARDLLLSSAHTNTQYIRLKNSTSDKGNKSSLMLYLLPYRIIWRGVFFSLIWTLAHSLPLSLTLTFSILLGAWALIRLLCCVFATPTHSSSSILLELLVFAWAAVTPNPCIQHTHKKNHCRIHFRNHVTIYSLKYNIRTERKEHNNNNDDGREKNTCTLKIMATSGDGVSYCRNTIRVIPSISMY